MTNYISCFYKPLNDWNKKIYTFFLVYSNLIFFIPSIIAFTSKNYINAIMHLFILIFSSVYHNKHSNAHQGIHDHKLIKWYYCDIIICGITILNYLRLKEKIFKLKYFALIILMIICQKKAVTEYCDNFSGKQYTFYHTLWHLMGGLTCAIIEYEIKKDETRLLKYNT